MQAWDKANAFNQEFACHFLPAEIFTPVTSDSLKHKSIVTISPYKAKRVYFDNKHKIINFLFFTYSSTTFIPHPMVKFFFSFN